MGGIRDRVGDEMRRAAFVYLKRFEVGREEVVFSRGSRFKDDERM